MDAGSCSGARRSFPRKLKKLSALTVRERGEYLAEKRMFGAVLACCGYCCGDGVVVCSCVVAGS